MSASLLKRISAYMIDLIILGIVIISIGYLIPESANTLKLQSTLNKLTDAMLSDGITLKDYIEGYVNIMYNLDKEKVIFTIINIITIFIYFTIIPFITKGKTIGNYIMNIKIKNKNDDKVSMIRLGIRNFIINGLGYLIIQLFLIKYGNPNNYFYILTICAIIQLALVIISLFMIKYKENKCGLQDIISGTIVISTR